MTIPVDIQQWLRMQCHEYVYDLRGVFRVAGSTQWPLTAIDAADLEAHLREQGHLLPLPKEPAALANVLEVSVVDFLLDRIAATDGQLTATRGGERVYPDLEITGPGVGGAFYAVDIKVAAERATAGVIGDPRCVEPVLSAGPAILTAMADGPVAISLFSGAGGLDLGVEAAGYRVTAAVEHDTDAALTMEKSFHHLASPTIRKDILQVPTREILRQAGLRRGQSPDLLVGGPPCAPFSKSGFWLEWKRAGLDPGASLLQAYTRVLAEAKPRAFILENVYALTYKNKASRPAYERLLRGIDDAGYDFRAKVLNAADCQSCLSRAIRVCGNAACQAVARRRMSPQVKPWPTLSVNPSQKRSTAASTLRCSAKSRLVRTISSSPPSAAMRSPCSSGAAATGRFS